jgi:precorrin-2 methylase
VSPPHGLGQRRIVMHCVRHEENLVAFSAPVSHKEYLTVRTFVVEKTANSIWRDEVDEIEDNAAICYGECC